MDTKLTLKLDRDIIEQAKIYAKTQNTSLSQLIETYLELLVDKKDDSAVTTLVKSLSGVVKLPKNADYRKIYKKHLQEKYGK
jgi:hypothetical protein